jgi:thiamine transporter ThiT
LYIGVCEAYIYAERGKTGFNVNVGLIKTLLEKVAFECPEQMLFEHHLGFHSLLSTVVFECSSNIIENRRFFRVILEVSFVSLLCLSKNNVVLKIII